jgi:hypothetical protein
MGMKTMIDKSTALVNHCISYITSEQWGNFLVALENSNNLKALSIIKEDQNLVGELQGDCKVNA